MVVFTIFSHGVKRSYQTTLCSKATGFYTISSFLSVIIPLIIAYKSEGFWKKYDLHREQPDVHFKHQLFFVLETGIGINPIVWSTFQNLNQNVKDIAGAVHISNYEEDVDDDGLNDRLEMSITVPIPPEQNVYSATLLLCFDYKLQKSVNLQMEGLAYIHHSSGIPGSELVLTGELKLNQKKPLQQNGYHYQYNSSVVGSSKDDKNFVLEHILKSYSSRTLTTRLENVLPIWKSGRGPEQNFKINLSIQYPEETILCQLGFWQLIKWAWVQYASVLLVALYLGHKVKVFIFSNQVFPTIHASVFKEHYT